MLKFFEQIQPHFHKIAIHDTTGPHTYQALWEQANTVAQLLQQTHNAPTLQGARVGFLAHPTADYVVMLWATWLAEGIAVPICISYPLPEIAHITEDAGILYTLQKEQDTITIHTVGQASKPTNIPNNTQDEAIIIYTSGTTGKPKGAVLTHANLTSQITILVKAWEWKNTDSILHTLPLHHVHGIVNVLLCALWTGATVDFLQKFDAKKVWEAFTTKSYTLYMAVPTIYNRLVESWEEMTEAQQQKGRQALQNMRLMVSGSAALPAQLLEKWQNISTHFLLERYGMTEIGMAISNPLHGIRKTGSIGLPLAGVQARLVTDNNEVIATPETVGELQIKSDSVFLAYWQKIDVTTASFTLDGWFKTGDIAKQDADGYYYLLGRNSVDILKTGGYKVSALEIESILLQHQAIRECAVVGISDADWGDKVVAAIVWKANMQPLTLIELRDWLKQSLAPYKIPMQLITLQELPRNAMGKVIKNEVKKMIELYIS